MEEKETIKFMISLYCRKNHKENLCEECGELLDYAYKKIDNCRHKENKTFCSVCKTHCYSPVMKERIREVMKFSGPRMLIYNPPLAVSHVIYTLKHKLEKE